MVKGAGEGREEDRGEGVLWTTLPSHYKTVRSSAGSVMVFVVGRCRVDCDDRAPCFALMGLYVNRFLNYYNIIIIIFISTLIHFKDYFV